MNRLGISSKEEFNKTYNLLKGLVEGIYTHIYDAENEKTTNNQVVTHKEINHGFSFEKLQADR